MLASSLPSWVLRDIRENRWKGFGWQWLKRRIAEAIAECLVESIGAKAVFLTELHGGEQVIETVGDKDIDLIVEVASTAPSQDLVEAVSERKVKALLYRVLGDDPYNVLAVPNIVEIHYTSGSSMARHLKSMYARPIRLV